MCGTDAAQHTSPQPPPRHSTLLLLLLLLRARLDRKTAGQTSLPCTKGLAPQPILIKAAVEKLSVAIQSSQEPRLLRPTSGHIPTRSRRFGQD